MYQRGSLLGCQEIVSNTTLTIVCTINVSVDCDCFDVSNPNLQHPDSTLKKKSNSICYHAVHVAIVMQEILTGHVRMD